MTVTTKTPIDIAASLYALGIVQHNAEAKALSAKLSNTIFSHKLFSNAALLAAATAMMVEMA